MNASESSVTLLDWNFAKQRAVFQSCWRTMHAMKIETKQTNTQKPSTILKKRNRSLHSTVLYLCHCVVLFDVTRARSLHTVPLSLCWFDVSITLLIYQLPHRSKINTVTPTLYYMLLDTHHYPLSWTTNYANKQWCLQHHTVVSWEE